MPRSFEEWNKEYEQYGGARRKTSAPSSNASPFGQILKPQFMVDPNSRANFVPRSAAPVRHPYADYMTQWNAVKADAANMGLADSYGMPLQQYYALKGKPDWMVQADAADYQRTLAENPAAPAKIRPTAVYDGVAADKREAIANRDYARYAQKMQQMPALEQWFGQFANDYTASYYKDQQQQYQPSAAQTPTSEQKLDEMYDRTPTKASQIAMQYEMERDGLSAPRESAVNAPTDQVLKNYVAEMRKKLDSLVASGDTRSQTYKTTKREVESGERQLLRFRPDYVQFDQENPDAMRKNAGAVNAPRPDVALKDPQYAMINYIDRVPNTKDGIDITQFVKSKFPQGSVEEQAAYPAIAMVQDFDLDKIYTHMSNSEKGIYNTIYHTEGKEKAEEYLRSLYKELAYRQNIELQQDFSAYAKAHPFNATMASIGITPFQGLGVLGGLEQLVGGEYYTPYSGVYGPTVAKETIRGTVTKDMNPLERTLYGAGTSVGDMLSLLVAFGPYGGRVGLPAASYTSSQRESALKGGNGLQSTIVAAGDAAVEAITETIGWNRLRGLFEKGDLLKYGFKHVLSQIAQNGLFEGLEEMPGPTAHLFLDSVFMGANSEYNRRLKAMGGSGTMSDEVKDSLFKDVFTETLQGFGGGFIAGGVMSGGADISGSIANSQQVESVQKQLITENPWMSNETALQIAQQRTGMSPPDITPYEKAQQEYAENEAPGMQAVASVEKAAAQPYAPIRPTSEVQEDTARDMQDVPETLQKAPVRPTSEVQEDTPRDINPFVVSAKMDGQDVTISGMESVGQNATVKTEDGKTIPLEQIEITDIGMNSLYNMARAFNDKDAANTFLGMFDGKIGVPAYIRAYTQYYTEGIRGTGTDALDNTATGQMLSPMARDAAYQTGQQVRIGLSEKAWGNFPVQAEKGYTGLVKVYTSKVNTDNQNKLQLIDRSAKKFGMQVVVVDSLRNANGMYGGGNKIYVAMDAIDGGITKAASHEFLHYARQQDEGAYNQLKDIVLQAVGSTDVVAQRIQQEIDRHAAAGIKLTSDAALEEIVAQALPDVVLNEQTAAQLANDNPTLFQKIVQWLREFVAKWKESFTGSPEAEALAKNGKAYQDALALFERTLENAAGVAQGETVDAGVAYSLKSTDSEGNQLSPQQQEFFKDSKVRDDQGRLVPMYHGRKSVDGLYQFNMAERRGLHGRKQVGAYFSAVEDYAKMFPTGFDNPTIAAYLNIKNPLILTNDVTAISAVDGETMNKYIEQGYDGIVLNETEGPYTVNQKFSEVLVFYPNQIKSITNTAPTDSPDIRFSLKSTIPSDADAQIAEISELRAAISDIKAQLDITEGAQISGTAVNNLAGKIIRGTGSKYSAVALSDNLGKLFRYLREKSPDYNDAIAATSDVAKAVLMNAPQGEMNLDDASMALALDIYQQYFDLPEIKTVADKAADKLDEVRTRYANRVLDIRRQYNERAKEKLSDLREQYAQRDARKEETATRNGYINQIKRIAGELSERLLSNTDKSNIPEGMKKAVLSMLQSLDFVTEKTGERLSTKFALLQNEYQKLRDGGLNSDTNLSGMYDEDVDEMLESLASLTANKSIFELETDELELVRNVVRKIQHMVATENKLFAQDRKETITDMGQKSIQWLYQQKSKKEWQGVTHIIQTMLTENTLNAETFFAQFDGTPIHDLYVALRDGLDTHILNNKQTEDYLKQAMKDYGYKEWSKSAKQTLQTESGGVLELSIDEMLTLYATFKREGLTKTNHILGGGVTIKDAQNRIPAKLTKGDMDKLSGMLTEQQRAYADHMVNYLSTVGAEWGNEVSMKLNGFKKFNEKYYIPFRTNEDYTKKAPGQMGDIRLKAGSFTKSLTKRANTPIVIEPFTQLWAQHAEQMSMYNAFALPIEDMTRVWNYRDAEDRASSVKNAISSAFTRTGNDYIRNFLTDLNGGAITPVGQGLFDKLISITKRGSVSANLSVAVQQMSAGVRAMAEVEAKYFIPGSVKGVRYRRSYAELLKWSPTARLKQWGYFDTSMTRTIYERAKGGFMQWIQDKASWAAQQGDMLNWAQIWEAVKLETKAKTGLQGDALLEASARRFRDVVDRTQVVDSIFHRTEWARSKSGLVKLATAFKSEPMMMYNMLFRAKMAAANGNNGRAARYVGGVVSSMILNAALAAIVAGFRDRKNEKKDEKGNIIGVRTYEDKYVDAFMDKLVDAPMSIIPILSDVYSMWQGYSADRLDMQPLEKFVNAAKAITDDKPWAQKFPKVVDFISMATGIPAFNVYRDTNALYQGVYELVNKNTLKGAAYDVTLPIDIRLEAAKANVSIRKDAGLYYDILVSAHLYGTKEDFETVKKYMMANGKNEDTIYKTFKDRIRSLEPLVQQGAQYFNANDIKGYSTILDALIAKGYSKDMSVEMIQAEAGKIVRDAKPEEGAETGAFEEGSGKTMYTFKMLTDALDSGKDEDIKTIMDQFQAEGKDMSTIRQQVTTKFKPIYYAAHLRGDTATMKRIETTLTKYLPYKNERKENDFKEWLSDSYYSDLYTLIDNGDATSAARIRKDMADKQIDNLGDIRDRLKTYYSARYKELLAIDKAAAAKLKATLVSLSFSPEMIDNWGRQRK